MSRSTISTYRDSLVRRLSKNESTRAKWAESNVDKTIAFQIRALRNKAGWTQAEFAKELGITHPNNVSARLENPRYGKHTLTTLKKIAAACDVALVVWFIPFSRLIDWESGTHYVDHGLSPAFYQISSFGEDAGIDGERVWYLESQVAERVGEYGQRLPPFPCENWKPEPSPATVESGQTRPTVYGDEYWDRVSARQVLERCCELMCRYCAGRVPNIPRTPQRMQNHQDTWCHGDEKSTTNSAICASSNIRGHFSEQMERADAADAAAAPGLWRLARVTLAMLDNDDIAKARIHLRAYLAAAPPAEPQEEP